MGEEMRIIDMHTHAWNNLEINKNIKLEKDNFIEDFEKLSLEAKNQGIEKCMVYLSYPSLLLDTKKFETFKNALNSENSFSNLRFGVTIDPDEEQYELILERAKELNIKSLKFFTYEQEVIEKNFEHIGKIAKKAEELGFFISICCTYGSKKIYTNDGIKLAIYLSDIVKCPIIMAHAGASRVFDAMSVAFDCPQVYLDLAFTLVYWQGSSVIPDVAFAIKKLGSERFLYGSDHPFVSFQESQKTALDFFNKYDFSKEDIENIMYKNAEKLLQQY